jgi:hypothetical protein
VNEGYILYKFADDVDTGKTIFLYVQKTKGLQFFYTEKPVRAKRYTLFKAIFISLFFRFSFVSFKLVKIYN